MNMFHRRRFMSGAGSSLLAGGFALAGVPALHAATETPLLAAAASLRFVLPELIGAFHESTGQHLRLSFSSSGNLSRQIRQGGPFAIFLSADEEYVLQLKEDGVTPGDGDVYALGRLCLFVPQGSPVPADGELKGLRYALEKGQITKFAIANPEHAPYGRAAREVLQNAKLWEQLKPYLVFGENVSQAAQFALTGSCQCAIIARSLAVSEEFSRAGTMATVRADWHAPLRQRMVLLPGAGETARAFYAFLQTETARTIFERHGFASPQTG